ncbi:uncharacterized protein BJ212DRAFT_1343595 [Suillus subaureus]|uniref:Uncharacterized protein n=1 Tax=Suillus subaureus TaxID=48587 RepID=A0A9P7EF16_9AGAM|nr:uncharacterized protein BJ212DRAFT_1343595 [Suillus subaureus]KAG1819873.1 hypothetical protein BJ212DRAFT_1343595 [Suillus subaureus]
MDETNRVKALVCSALLLLGSVFLTNFNDCCSISVPQYCQLSTPSRWIQRYW